LTSFVLIKPGVITYTEACLICYYLLGNVLLWYFSHCLWCKHLKYFECFCFMLLWALLLILFVVVVLTITNFVIDYPG